MRQRTGRTVASALVSVFSEVFGIRARCRNENGLGTDAAGSVHFGTLLNIRPVVGRPRRVLAGVSKPSGLVDQEDSDVSAANGSLREGLSQFTEVDSDVLPGTDRFARVSASLTKESSYVSRWAGHLTKETS
jgi:hypothetical protein